MVATCTRTPRTVEVPDPLVLREGRSAEEILYCLNLGCASAGNWHRLQAFSLREVEVRRLYQLFGCRTTSQFAATYSNIGRRECRDLLAAGLALAELPLIDAAFVAGEVCWS